MVAAQVMVYMDDSLPTDFLKFDSSNPLNSPEAQILNCRIQLEDLRDLFNFKIDLRLITPESINTLEQGLRRILGVIYRLKGISERNNLLESSDDVIQAVGNVQINLYTVDNILSKSKLTLKESKELFSLLRSCGGLLEEALEYFLV